MVMWIGQHASPDFMMNVFGVNSHAEVNVDNVRTYIRVLSKNVRMFCHQRMYLNCSTGIAANKMLQCMYSYLEHTSCNG